MNNLELLQNLGKDIEVLYAEDEAGVRKSTKELLANFFPKLQVVRDGQEAWDLWQLQRADLIITDVRMPHMDGMELARRVHEVLPQQRILVISAYSDTESLINLLNQGISGFILKPIKINQLIEILIREAKIIHSLRHEQSTLQELTREIDRRSNALDQANRNIVLLLQSRENMLRLVAHELRTPLNSLNGFLQLLQVQLGNQPEYQEYLKFIFDAVYRLEKSTQKALDLIRITSTFETHKEWLSVTSFFENRPENIVINPVSASFQVFGNPLLFGLTIDNILDNFAKYGKPPYELSIVNKDNILELWVRDHGPGFRPQTLEKIQLGPFHSGDIFHHHQGFGLGMELIRTCLAKMDIQLRLANHPQGGAVYILVVPEGNFRAPETEQPQTPPDMPPHQGTIDG